MFKFLIVICSLMQLCYGAFAIEINALRPFRFTEVKSLKEISGLPPRLQITIELMCNEKFVKVIRHDTTNPKTGKASIAVGALVEENLLSSCAGQSKELTVSAGNTFSGREYSVFLIKK